MGSEENEQLQLRLRIQQILLMCGQSALLRESSLPVAKFKREFDMVIIDTPPMLQMPDARIVGRIADTVILVTRAGHTTRDVAVAAKQRFAEDRATNVSQHGSIIFTENTTNITSLPRIRSTSSVSCWY